MSNLRAIVRVPRTPAGDHAPPNHGMNPPHDLDAEAAVLSALMLDQKAYGQVSDLLPADPADMPLSGDPHMHSDDNRHVYRAICAIHADGGKSDVVTVAAWLRARELLQGIGGAVYLGELTDATPHVGHVRDHALIIRDCALQRAAIRLHWHALAEAYGDVGDRQTWRERNLARMELLVARGMKLEARSGESAIGGAMQQIAADAENGVTMGLIRTGQRWWDKHAGGLYLGDLAVLVAPSKGGKTAMGLQLGRGCASSNDNVDVHVIAMEQDSEELSLRMVQQIGQIDMTGLRMGKNTPPNFWSDMTGASTEYAKLPITFTCRPRLNSQEVCNAIGIAAGEAGRHERKLVVIVDNLHDIDQEVEQNREPRADESRRLRMVMWAIKKATNRHRCATLVVAQGNARGEIFNSPRAKQPVNTLCTLDKCENHHEGDIERDLHWHIQRSLPEARTKVYYHGAYWLFSETPSLEPPWM